MSIIASCMEPNKTLDSIDVKLDEAPEYTVIIEASQEAYNSETRTTLQADGSVYWNPNDEISLFFINGDNGGNKFTSLNEETIAIAEFSGTISGITGGGEDLNGESYFWAVYPYSEGNSCDGESVTTTLSNVQQAVENTFADDLFITVARSNSVKMAFKNVCGGIKFCVSHSDIKSVTFRGNNNEKLAGKVRVGFDGNNKPAVKEFIDEKAQVTVYAPNGGTFKPGEFYYIILLPTVFESGFTMTFNKSDNNTCYVCNYEKPVSVKRSIFTVIRDKDTGDAVIKDDASGTGGSKSGFYLGINGFNNGLYTYPIKHLSEDSEQGYYSFIDGLTTKNGTWLYYAVDKAIDKLKAATFPDDLYDVAIVTFTDGLDRGSLDMSDYLSLTEYLSALNVRLTDESVQGQKISAYTIGVKGNDVTNDTSYENNLKKLATSTDNVFNVKNMSEVNDAFLKIANLLGETKYVQKFMMEIAGPSHNEKCRFTFDKVSSYSSSKQYIEGTFNRLNRTLTDIKYVGLTSTSGSIVQGVRNEDNFYVFTFEGLQSTTGEKVPGEYVQHWYTEEGIWQKDSEFVFDPGTVGLEKIKRSAAIMLNLDCSSSLEGDSFGTLQSSAKTFIKKLIENAVDPNEVASVSLDKSDVTLPLGKTITLKATVLPTTALLKDVEWSSTNSAVATVDNNGVVTSHSPGNATIIAKTVDGGCTAICKVSVVKLVDEIVLNHKSLELYTEESATLIATVSPADATNREVLWSSSNPSIVSVNQEGLVEALAPGTSTISVTAQDGSGVVAKCDITVKSHVSAIGLSATSLEIGIDSSEKLDVIITPSDVWNTNFSVSSSDTSVAIATKSGQSVIIEPIALGTSTITVISEDGGHKATCDITITLSTNPTHLALAVLRNDIRYYIPLSEYTGEVPSGYTKDGIAIVSDTESFVLDLNNATTSTKTRSEALNIGTLPSQEQASVIVENWSSINSAITTYGGTSLGSRTYWTCSTGNGTWHPTPGSSVRPGSSPGYYDPCYYYYSSSGIYSTESSDAKYYVRCLK